MREFRFKITSREKKTKARVGEIVTPHGVIKTPAFVPVGTQATVKSVTPEELEIIGTKIFFVNTYHVYLRPGIEVIKKLGGLHSFMNWSGPIITDSGGFQVFSLGRQKLFAKPKVTTNIPTGIRVDTFPLNKDSPEDRFPNLVKITDEGVEFQSHWDGSKHIFTPESSMKYQWDLGSDIHIAFDDCTPYPATHDQAKKSMERTHKWAARSLSASGKCKVESVKLGKPMQSLYGVIQGSVFKDLRKESAKFISTLDFDGIAIGGVSVGESKAEMRKVLEWVIPLLPDDKPRHLLGVGEIDDIFTLVENGIDTFDCVQPTRLARMGRVLVKNKQIDKLTNLRNNKHEIDITKTVYKEDANPIEIGCNCYTCRNYSRAYIHHLFHVRELLGYRLATIHNLWFIHRLVEDIREAVRQGKLLELKRKWV